MTLPFRRSFGLLGAGVVAWGQLVAAAPAPGVVPHQESSPPAVPPDQGPPPPQRPNLPQQPQDGRQPNDRPGEQNPGLQFRLPPTVEFVPNVVYATVSRNAGESPSQPASVPPNPVRPEQDGSNHELLLNAFFPKQSGDQLLPAIIYIHGGGFTGGSREIGNQYSAVLAMGGYFTVTIDYRLLGDAPFPAAIHDCKAAVRFLRANAEELGIDPERIGVWGHSAGGHLAAFLGTSGNVAESHGDVGDFDDADSSVTCAVDFFGPSDFTLLRQTRGNNGEIRIFGPGEIDDRERKLAEASPVHWVDPNDPPFLIIHGTEDRVVPIEQSEKLHEALVGASVASELIRVEGAGHGIRDANVLMQAAEFFDKHVGGSAAASLARMQQQATDRPMDFQTPPGGGG